MQRVILIDDDLASYYLLSELAGGFDVEVFYFSDGKSALQAIQSYKDIVSFVLLNVRLPNENGYELCKEIKRIVPDLPVIAHIAIPMNYFHSGGWCEGFDSVLVKPVEIDEYAYTFKKYLETSAV